MNSPALDSTAPEAESRLERMIARLVTQRALLGHVAGLVGDRPGPILEIGLGKGRTYSHLENLFRARSIWAFDFEVHAPAHSRPADDRIITGDFRESLKSCWPTIGAAPVFVHADIGTESRKADADLARFVGGVTAGNLADGGYLMGDRDMAAEGLVQIERPDVSLPAGITAWPYFLYRRADR